MSNETPDWTFEDFLHRRWSGPPYKSPAFLASFPSGETAMAGLERFRGSLAYTYACDRGVIVDDRWVFDLPDWRMPAYKSPAFYELLLDAGLEEEAFGSKNLDAVRASPAYRGAVGVGLIVDDAWVGPTQPQHYLWDDELPEDRWPHFRPRGVFPSAIEQEAGR